MPIKPKATYESYFSIVRNALLLSECSLRYDAAIALDEIEIKFKNLEDVVNNG